MGSRCVRYLSTLSPAPHTPPDWLIRNSSVRRWAGKVLEEGEEEEEEEEGEEGWWWLLWRPRSEVLLPW